MKFSSTPSSSTIPGPSKEGFSQNRPISSPPTVQAPDAGPSSSTSTPRACQIPLEVPFAGRLFYYLDCWKSITSDPIILDWVKGYKIPFSSCPVQFNVPLNSHFNKSDHSTISSEINKILDLGAIIPCGPLPDQFLSSIFLLPKKDGSHRLIINLKNLNKFIVTSHFKMDDIRTVCKLLCKGDFLCTLDLKHAYFLLPIHSDFKKYLRFIFNDKLFEFNCLPFGLNFFTMSERTRH